MLWNLVFCRHFNKIGFQQISVKQANSPICCVLSMFSYFFLQRKEVFSNTLLPKYKALFFYITNESTLPFGTTTRCGFCSQGKHGCWSKAVQGQYHCYSTLRLVMALISSLLCTWAATLSFTSCSRSFHFLKIEMKIKTGISWYTDFIFICDT